jgi:hypothetical protein
VPGVRLAAPPDDRIVAAEETPGPAAAPGTGCWRAVRRRCSRSATDGSAYGWEAATASETSPRQRDRIGSPSSSGLTLASFSAVVASVP